MKYFSLILFVIFAFVCSVEILPKNKTNDRTKKLSTQTTFKSMAQPIREYAKKHELGRLPEAGAEQDGNGTSILVKELQSKGFFQFSESNLTDEKPYQLVDGWGNPMRYRPWRGKKDKEGAHNKKSYDLWSAGPDGLFETEEDNIVNWSRVE